MNLNLSTQQVNPLLGTRDKGKNRERQTQNSYMLGDDHRGKKKAGQRNKGGWGDVTILLFGIGSQ